MSFRILYTPSYNKRARRFLRKHPELLPQYEKTLKLLEIDPFHPSLRLHRLKGSLSDLHSVSINISYRITLEFILQDREIIPVHVGSHDEVYRP
ncbi:type II toxin-antitoxin system RelE/ParE family toxin [Geoalkalibacter halelectricus]|uniref:Plasmid stabilization protein n=1 Tax=Geoalkalibacter halelectricus TaxID=2847045 RepID=A0ABY5ZMB7_9BACT|nr:plasmid stabilization protein [Geoalkalibacter halelectricus]MDO3378368.1 plasmid stabilization protein [Geoalkalibacter halelectricus]UWZ80312.1 plasmid stabilization protein [Geoalkalibacter halelectricus]